MFITDGDKYYPAFDEDNNPLFEPDSDASPRNSEYKELFLDLLAEKDNPAYSSRITRYGGAGWTFIFWGVLHGIFICINHLWRKTKIMLPRFLCWLLTFNVVNIAWIFFRANSFESAMNIVKAMFDVSKLVVPHSSGLGKYIEAFRNGSNILFSTKEFGLILGFLILSTIIFDNRNIEKGNAVVVGTLLATIFLYAFFNISKASEFLYFQF